MIKIVNIEPSKNNPEWDIVTAENVLSDFFQKQLEAKEWTGKRTSFPVKTGQTQFSKDQVFEDVEITTQESDQPFWEGQEPFEVTGKYYRNLIVPVTSPVIAS